MTDDTRTSDKQVDYIRTDELFDAMIPVATAHTLFDVHRDTIYAWIKEDSIGVESLDGSKMLGTRRRKMIRFGDLVTAARKRGHQIPAK